MINYEGDTLVEELCTLFNEILIRGRIPEKWKECITVPMFKKGKKTDSENYRGISLLGSVTKLFTKIIAEEVASTSIAEKQQGFRRNRSTIDAI